MEKGIDPKNYVQPLDKIKNYHLFIIQNKFLVERIHLERKFISGKLNNKEFNYNLHQLEQRWGDLQLYIAADTTINDYLKKDDLGFNEDTFFWHKKPITLKGHINPLMFPYEVH